MKIVLCADDNPVDLLYVTKVLHAIDPEMEIITVSNGVDALAKWRELRDAGKKLDLALIDNHMGEFDGKETIQFLRKENYGGLAYILTGDNNVTKSVGESISGIFYKPLNRHHIQEALNNLNSVNKTSQKYVDTTDLDDLIESLDSNLNPEKDPLLDFRCKVPCTFRPLDSVKTPTQGQIVNLNKKGLYLLSNESIFKNAKFQVKAPEPLNLDVDVLIHHHARCAEGFVYDCRFLYIRRALV